MTGSRAAPVSSARAAGPAGIRAGSPKKSTSTPAAVRSRSANRQTRPPARSRSARTANGGWVPPLSGMTSMPIEVRKATNRSNSDSGRSRSATVVNGSPVSTAQAPAWSQLPMCGRAAIAPRPEPTAVRRMSSLVIRIPVTMRSRLVVGSRNTSRQ